MKLHFDKSKKKQITTALLNSFLPEFQHRGIEKAQTIAQISKFINEKLDLKLTDEKMMIFKMQLSGRIRETLLNEESKYYLKGLDCEIIGVVGYYYYPQSEKDEKRIKEARETKVINETKNIQIKYAKGINYIKSIEL